jgi:hypothetical protein
LLLPAMAMLVLMFFVPMVLFLPSWSSKAAWPSSSLRAETYCSRSHI